MCHVENIAVIYYPASYLEAVQFFSEQEDSNVFCKSMCQIFYWYLKVISFLSLSWKSKCIISDWAVKNPSRLAVNITDTICRIQITSAGNYCINPPCMHQFLQLSVIFLCYFPGMSLCTVIHARSRSQFQKALIDNNLFQCFCMVTCIRICWRMLKGGVHQFVRSPFFHNMFKN